MTRPNPTDRIAELTMSLRAERSSAGYKERLRSKRDRRPAQQGHTTDRPGDRLHRALVGDPLPGDAEYLEQVLAAIKASPCGGSGNVMRIAQQLGVGLRTLRRWMGAYPIIGSAVRIAVLEAQLAAERAQL